MYNDKHDDINDDVDLTGIINDYNEDNELRRKIEEMKKQKEGQNASSQDQEDINPLTGERFHSPIFEDEKKNVIPDIRVDDEELTKTRVGFVDDASDKTLVIMDGKKKVTITDNEIEDEPQASDEYEDEDVNQEELGKTMVKPLSDVHVLEDEEEPRSSRYQDDDDEDEDEYDESKDKKMNKTITYIILGVVGVLIIVAAFFGIRYAIDNFIGGDDPKTEEKETPKDDEANKDDENNEGADITDKTAKIAALKKQKSTYEDQMKTANEKLKEADEAKKEAIQTLSSLEKTELVAAKDAQSKVSAYENNEYKKAVDDYEKILGDYNAQTDMAIQAQMKPDLDKAKANKDAAEKEYNRLTSVASNLTETYNTKKEEANEKKSSAETEITNQEKTIKDLESKIKDVDKQLSELE